MSQRDLLLIERVVWGLWAPDDDDPQAPAEMADDDEPVTNNDVRRARLALGRIAAELRTTEET